MSGKMQNNIESNPGPTSVVNGDHAKVANKQKIKKQMNISLVLDSGKGTDIPAGKSPEYQTKWSWQSPFTQASLAWISAIVGLLALAQGYGFVAPLVSGPQDYLANSQGGISWNFILLIGMLATGTVFAIAMSMRSIVKNRLRKFANSRLLPAALSLDGKFALAYFQGKCSICGGRLRFYNKPIAWRDVTKPNGDTKRVVAEREMAAECVRNQKRHWWYVDSAEERVSN